MKVRVSTLSRARAAASGRRAHQRCSVLGCPCRIDFSRAEAVLIASNGNATSISFFFIRLAILVDYDPPLSQSLVMAEETLSARLLRNAL